MESKVKHEYQIKRNFEIFLAKILHFEHQTIALSTDICMLYRVFLKFHFTFLFIHTL